MSAKTMRSTTVTDEGNCCIICMRGNAKVSQRKAVCVSSGNALSLMLADHAAGISGRFSYNTAPTIRA